MSRLTPPRSAAIIKGMTTATSSGVPVNGELIRELRINLGHSGADFALACKISPQHASDIELGKKAVSPPVLKRIADVLGVDIPTLRAVEAAPA
jgi:transcriptional regulator with XRE-family HTH domain